MHNGCYKAYIFIHVQEVGRLWNWGQSGYVCQRSLSSFSTCLETIYMIFYILLVWILPLWHTIIQAEKIKYFSCVFIKKRRGAIHKTNISCTIFFNLLQIWWFVLCFSLARLDFRYSIKCYLGVVVEVFCTYDESP